MHTQTTIKGATHNTRARKKSCKPKHTRNIQTHTYTQNTSRAQTDTHKMQTFNDPEFKFEKKQRIENTKQKAKQNSDKKLNNNQNIKQTKNIIK